MKSIQAGPIPQSLATISAAGDEKYNFTLLPGQARRLREIMLRDTQGVFDLSARPLALNIKHATFGNVSKDEIFHNRAKLPNHVAPM